jgi:hypothetical protein
MSLQESEQSTLNECDNPERKLRSELRPRGMDGDELLKWIISQCRIDKETGCWIFTRYLTDRGYGALNYNGRTRKLHTITFELNGGLVPPGMELHHTCETRACCNPEHLEPKTHIDNVRLGGVRHISKRLSLVRTHCARGHELIGDNVFVNRNSTRCCRVCERLRGRVARDKDVKHIPAKPLKPMPSKATGKPKSVKVSQGLMSIHLFAGQKDLLKTASAATGTTLSSWARTVLVREAKKQIELASTNYQRPD